MKKSREEILLSGSQIEVFAFSVLDSEQNNVVRETPIASPVGGAKKFGISNYRAYPLGESRFINILNTVQNLDSALRYSELLWKVCIGNKHISRRLCFCRAIN